MYQGSQNTLWVLALGVIKVPAAKEVDHVLVLAD
jgi:hypothetical protein